MSHRIHDVKADLMRYPGWYLATHPFSLTRSHHDSVGFASYVAVLQGVKLWFTLHWRDGHTPTPKDWLRRTKLMTRGDMVAIEYDQNPAWFKKDRIDWDAFDSRDAAWEDAHRVARWEVMQLDDTKVL